MILTPSTSTLLLLVASLAAVSAITSPFHKPPQIVKKLDKHFHLKFGPLNRFVLECVADAQPSPVYTWYRNSAVLPNDTSGIKFIADSSHSQLEFTTPGPDHDGYYYCEAENALGKARSAVVHVTERPVVPPKGTVAPTFLTAPENEIPSVGSTAEFHCVPDGIPQPTIVWTKNGEVIPDETGTKLVLHNIGQADVANYACNASNVAGYEYKDVYLNVLTVSASIVEGPRDQIVSKGSNVSMRCRTEGHPRPVITWRVNGSVIPADADSDAAAKYAISPLSGELTVRQAGLEDQGQYECEAANHGRVVAKAQLTVRSKTEIIEGPSDQAAPVFTSLRMPCTVVSDLSENLTVLWKKDNIDLGQVGFPLTERISQDENYSLVIKNLTFNDSGTYTCVASTATNLVTDSGLLTVVGVAPVLLPPAPVAPQLEGGAIRLHCELSQGFPAPAIVWFKDGIELDASSLPELEMEGATVVIPAARVLHSGDYTCRAANAWGSATGDVNVKVRRRTQIVSRASYVEYNRGDMVIFHCDVDVDSNLLGSLRVDWYKGDNKLDLIPWLDSFPVGEGGPLESGSLVSDTYDTANSEGVGTEADAKKKEEEQQQRGGTPRMVLMPNSSLRITGMQQEDLGYYSCEARTELESVGLKSELSQIYIPTSFPYWIIVVILLALLAILIIVFCVWRIRQRSRGKGYYGVKDIEKSGAKHNRSDIYYTTEDGDSVMNEQDNVPINNATPTRTPIFTPKTIRHLANMDKSTGSVGSLLEDDEFLRKGMDEDGSFRERYAD